MALIALACGGRTLGDGFEDEWVDPGDGSGATGSGAVTGSGATGSGATGSGATGSGTTGVGGFGATGSGTTGVGGFGATTGTGGVAGVGAFGGNAAAGGVGGIAGAGAVGGFAGAAGAGGVSNTCPSPLIPIYRTIHDFESVYAPNYAAGLYVYTDDQNDDTPQRYGYIFPSPSDDLSVGLVPGVIGGAFRLVGYDFVPGSWGAGVGVYTPCIEASTALGINFLIQSDVTVRVSVTMPENLPVFDGGECQGDYSVCVQNYVDFAPLPQFTSVRLYWEQFTGGRPAAFDPSRIVGINFQALYPGRDFVFTIDELEFFFF